MTLHAVSRDPGVYSSDCLYIMINGYLDDASEEEVEQDNDVDPDEAITEIRFVPHDSSVLEVMYSAVQECTLLHPDPSSDLSEDAEDIAEDEEDVDPNEEFEGYAGGDAEGNEEEEDEELDRGFQRLMDRFGGGGDGKGNGNHPNPEQMDPDQFADAE